MFVSIRLPQVFPEGRNSYLVPHPMGYHVISDCHQLFLEDRVITFLPYILDNHTDNNISDTGLYQMNNTF